MSFSCSDDAALLNRLRDEALRDRPAFDADTHERILEAVRRRAGEPGGRPTLRPRHVVVVAACLGLACGAVAAWHRRDDGATGGGRGPDAEVAAAVGIDALPPFDVIEADVTAGIGSLAATVVGLPDWRTLAVVDEAVLEAWRLEDGRSPGGGPIDDAAGSGTPR